MASECCTSASMRQAACYRLERTMVGAPSPVMGGYHHRCPRVDPPRPPKKNKVEWREFDFTGLSPSLSSAISITLPMPCLSMSCMVYAVAPNFRINSRSPRSTSRKPVVIVGVVFVVVVVFVVKIGAHCQRIAAVGTPLRRGVAPPRGPSRV